MATLEQLEEGIRRAHAAGNAEHVRALGQAYRQMQGQGAAAPTQPSGPMITIGGRQMSVADYRALPNSERQRLRDQVAQANPEAETQSSALDPFVQGATFGWGDEMRGAVQGGMAAMQGRDFGDTYRQTVDQSRTALDQERRVNPVGSFAAEFAGAVPTGIAAGGQLAGRGATLGMRALTGAGVGAGQGAIYGAGASQEGERIGGGLTGFATGGVIGGAAPAIGQAVRRMATPLPASPAQNRAATTLQREGVDLTAGQRTGSKGLQYLEAELGGSRSANMVERQSEQFTRAALSRAGITADRATPEVLDQTFTTIGREFDNMALFTRTPLDQQLQNDLLSVVTDYVDVAGNPAPALERMMNRVSEVARANGGMLNGRPYQNIRSELGRLSKAANGETKIALQEMQEALDDAVERNLSGQTLDMWRDLRNRYRNLLVIERAATGAGAATASGLISPAQLRNAAIGNNRRSFARGNSDYTELANAGVQAMTPLPQSGTTPRAAARSLMNLPTIVGGVAGAPGGLPGMVLGGLAGAVVPAAVGRAITSRPGRALLSNQAFTGQDAGAVERLLRRSASPIAGQISGR